ncbi:hypothetical protein V8E54_008202 [Elaphomyces granulatus]
MTAMTGSNGRLIILASSMKKVSGAGTAGRYHYANQDLKAFLDLAIPPGQAGRGQEDVPAGTAGLETVARYRPALNTMRNLGNLFATQGHLDEATSLDPTQGCTGDSGGTQAGVGVAANIALDGNEKKKSRSVIRKLMRKLLS